MARWVTVQLVFFNATALFPFKNKENRQLATISPNSHDGSYSVRVFLCRRNLSRPSAGGPDTRGWHVLGDSCLINVDDVSEVTLNVLRPDRATEVVPNRVHDLLFIWALACRLIGEAMPFVEPLEKPDQGLVRDDRRRLQSRVLSEPVHMMGLDVL